MGLASLLRSFRGRKDIRKIRPRPNRYIRPVLQQLEERTLLSDTQPPVVNITRPTSQNPDAPEYVQGTSLEIRASASDATTGNSGILTEGFVFEYQVKPRGGQFGPWTTFPGFQTVITNDGDFTHVSTLFQVHPYNVYGFRITAMDGAKNTAVSAVAYAEPIIVDTDIVIVIDPQCSPRLPPESVRIASEIIDRAQIGDRIGILLGNDQNIVTFPLTRVTGPNVREEAKAALHGSFSYFAPKSMTDLMLLAQQQLTNAPGNGQSAMVVLTDGVHSRLAPLLLKLERELDPDISIFAIGYFNNANQGPLLDLIRLRNGTYYFKPGAAQLDDLERRLHGNKVQVRLGEFDGTIRHGDHLSGEFVIGPSQQAVIGSVQWSAGNVDLELIGPDGTRYARDTVQSNPNVQFLESERYESIRIDSADWGLWQVRLIGVSVPGESLFSAAIESSTGDRPHYTVRDRHDFVNQGESLFLGTVAQNSPWPAITVDVHNGGAAPLHLRDPLIPDSFVLVDFPTSPIAPGTSAPITIQMKTTSIGESDGFVRFFLGNTISQSDLFTFMISGSVNDGSPDTLAPSSPTRPDLDSGSDLGNSNNDDLTSQSTLVFRGRAEPNSILRLYQGSSVMGVTTVGHSGRWSMTVGPVSDGEHVFSAESLDAAGNVSAPSVGMSVTVDTVTPDTPLPPTLKANSDSGISNSDRITNVAEPVLFGTGTPDGLVEIFDGLQLIATTFSDSSGAWQLGNWELSNGIHDLSIRVKDPACNTSNLSGVTRLTIDTVAPSAPTQPDLNALADAGTSNSDDVTNLNKLLIGGITESNGIVHLFDGTTPLGVAHADHSGAWNYETIPLAHGFHRLTTKVMDTAGNTSVASPFLDVLVDTIAPSAPTVDLTAQSDLGRLNTDNLTSDNTPTFTGNAEAHGQVELFAGGSSLGKASVTAQGAWTLTANRLPDGDHLITAQTMDQAGNLSGPSTSLRVTIDTNPPPTPSAPVLDPTTDLGFSNSDGITRDATPTFMGTTSPSTAVQLLEGTRILGLATSNLAGQWFITSSGLSNGSHSVTVRVHDPAGNASADSPPFVVRIDTVAPVTTVPDLDDASDRGISSLDNWTNDTTPDFRGVTEAFSHVEIYSAGRLLGQVQAGATGAWLFRSEQAGVVLNEGLHTIVARSIDLAGNVGTISPPLTITVDTTPPLSQVAPQLNAGSDTGISNSDRITARLSPVIQGTGDPNSVVEVLVGTTPAGTVIANQFGEWSMTVGPLSPGVHQVTARAHDSAGNTGPISPPLEFTIDNAAPARPPAPDLDATSDGGRSSEDNVTDDTTPLLRGTAEPGSTLHITASSILLGSTAVDEQGAWSYTTPPMSHGLHRIQVRSTDRAGNESPPSLDLTVEVDLAAPVIERVELVRDSRGRFGQVRITFSEDLNPDTASHADNFQILSRGKKSRPVAMRPPVVSDRSATLTLVKAVTERNLSKYTLRTGGLLSDMAGNLADGDQDGLPGGSSAIPLSSTQPLIASHIDRRSDKSKK